MFRTISLTLTILLMACASLTVHAQDWPRFRGPEGSGVAAEATVPAMWSPDANIGWKTEMPGPGASSPIIIGNKAFVTCYSGYGLSQEEPGEIENLVRHLVCVDLESGEKLWQKDVPVVLPEDPYSGIGVTAHGYASHTPVSDGENVYAFYGKGGVYAYDMDGNELWNAEVGKESDPAKWGSSSSPVVFENTVIVTASAESQSIIGFDKESGKELWRQEAKGLDNMWGTPTLVKVDDDRTDLVMCVAKELWGLDPSNGKLRWFADNTGSEQAYSSLVLDGNRVYALTGRGGGSIALDVGGSGDISATNTVWTGGDIASYSSPVRHESKLYVVMRGILTSVDATTGERLQRVRLKGARKTGGRFGSLDYPSPIVVGDKLFYLNGSGQMFVFQLGDEPEQIAVNQVTADKETFWGSPAVSNQRMVMRSDNYLYCVTDKGEEVVQDADIMAEDDEVVEESPRGGGRGGARRGGGGGRRGFNPAEMFGQLDKNSDDKLTMDELEGNRMEDRLKTLDKDDDKEISKEEFTSGITGLFRGGRGGGRSRPKDTRPDRPQRPERPESASGN